MNAYLGFDNLMNFFKLDSNPIFAQFYNDILAANENQNLDMTGASWGEMQTVFTYEMWEQFNDIEVMATFTDLDSDPLPISGEMKVSKLSGSIPRHKALSVLNETDYRQKLQQLYSMQSVAAMMGNDPASAVRNSLEEYLYTKLSALPNAHKNSLNYMLGQLKSRGYFELTAKNNPQGIQGLIFSNHLPATNRRSANFFTINATGEITYNTTEDPVKFFKDLVYEIRHRLDGNAYEDIVCEMDDQFFRDLMGHPKWALALALKEQPQWFYGQPNNMDNAVAYGQSRLSVSSHEQQVTWFKDICGFSEVHLTKAVVGVEKIVKLDEAAPKIVRPQMKAFDYGKVSIHPSGNFIKIIPVAPLRPDGSAISATIYEGRGIIEYWYDKPHKVQTWRSELTALPVMTMPSKTYICVCIKTLTLSVSTLDFAKSGSTKTVTATSSNNVTARTDASWLTVTVNNSNVISVVASANTGAARTASILVSDGDSTTNISVNQAANT